MLTAVVGSGGKTTYIRRQANAYREQGLRVLVTTTCHMHLEQGTAEHLSDIAAHLRTQGYCMAGIPVEASPGERKKIGPLPQAVFEQAIALADMVLVEADGSRGLPVKFPGAHEPVIPPGVDRIVIIQGQMAIGQTILRAAHRPELVCKCLGVPPEHVLTDPDLERVLAEGYLKPLSARYPQAELIVKKTIVESGELRYI
jgi:xanthine dehydrogenase accessory factor